MKDVILCAAGFGDRHRADAPAPSAEFERVLAEVCGRCPICGELRRLSRRGDGQWVVGCGVATHPGEEVGREMVERLIEAAQLSCPACGGRARVRGEAPLFQVVYEHEDACPGLEAMPLEDVFGGDGGWRSSYRTT